MSVQLLSYHLLCSLLTAILIAYRRQMLISLICFHSSCASFALPTAAQSFGIEGVARTVAQVLNRVLDERGDQAIGFGARHPLRQIFQLFVTQKSSDPRADVAAANDVRPLRHRRVSSRQEHRQDTDVARERQIAEDRFELRNLAGQRARAFGENQGVVAAIKERARVAQRLTKTATALDWNKIGEVLHVSALVLVIEKVVC